LEAARLMVSGSTSTTSDARLILMQQAIASQLNIDNGDKDPGGLSAGTGGDLVGTAVKWLTGQLSFSSGNSVNPLYNVDNGDGTAAWVNDRILESGGGTGFELNTSNTTFDAYFGTPIKKQLDYISTSSTDWNPVKAGDTTKDGYFVIDTDNALFAHKQVYATGQDLKNALEAFNSAKLLTTADGAMVYWAGDAAHAQTNDQDGLWKILVDHGIGIHG